MSLEIMLVTFFNKQHMYKKKNYQNYRKIINIEKKYLINIQLCDIKNLNFFNLFPKSFPNKFSQPRILLNLVSIPQRIERIGTFFILNIQRPFRPEREEKDTFCNHHLQHRILFHLFPSSTHPLHFYIHCPDGLHLAIHEYLSSSELWLTIFVTKTHQTLRC